jgi:hypothetical protein
MSSQFESLINLIGSSLLLQEEKDGLIASFALASDQEIESTVELFIEHPEWIEKISNNLKAKRVAVDSGNGAQWVSIIESEKDELDALERVDTSFLNRTDLSIEV